MMRRHRRVATICAAGVVVMVGFAYASVPLYRLFCQATGFDGTTQRAERPSSVVGERVITVRFDANVGQGLNWEFVPDKATIETKVGENVLAFYRVTNRSKKVTVGSA